jgi:hypothetical protein
MKDGADQDVNKAKENSRNWQNNPGRMALLKEREREIQRFPIPEGSDKWVPKFPTTRPLKAVIVPHSCG